MFGAKTTEQEEAIQARTEILLDRLSTVSKELAELRGTFDTAKDAAGLTKQVRTLRQEISTLEVEQSKLTERHEREQRETEHMVGLQRKRGEFEIESARREAVLEVREENLKAEREQFSTQMAFEKQQFDGQVKYLQDLMGQILKRLPTIGVDLSGEASPTVGEKKAAK